MFNILIAEDNKDLCELFCTTVNNAGFNAIGVYDGKEALMEFDKSYIDLLIADIMMPEINGFELTKSLRTAGYTLPILMVTAKDEHGALIRGFDSGVDDYLVKPINLEELIVRIKALLRRAKIANEKMIAIGKTVLDYDSMTVRYNNDIITLPQKEFLLLYKLLSYPDKIFTRQQIMDEIWGMDTETDARTINTHINRLRERFSDNDDFEISTIRGLGYKAVKNER